MLPPAVKRVKRATIGRRLAPQPPSPRPPWFEGYYTRVLCCPRPQQRLNAQQLQRRPPAPGSPGGSSGDGRGGGSKGEAQREPPPPPHSVGLVFGYYPRMRAAGGWGAGGPRGHRRDQPLRHASAYSAVLVAPGGSSAAPGAGAGASPALEVHEHYHESAAGWRASSGPAGRPNALGAAPGDGADFEVVGGGGGAGASAAARVASAAGSGLVEFEVEARGARLAVRTLSESQPWSGDGGGSPQGLLHLVPGVGLHWYVHSTATLVQWQLALPGAPALSGVGVAHLEKNWGASFPGSFIWAQGFATAPCAAEDGPGFSVEASFCLAGGVLPTLNLDRLPLPLPDMLLLGFRSRRRTWHFKPQAGAVFCTRVDPERGLLLVTARAAGGLGRRIELRVQAPPRSFACVGGPSRDGGFERGSAESYSAWASVRCFDAWGRLLEEVHLESAALEFGGRYAEPWLGGGGGGGGDGGW